MREGPPLPDPYTSPSDDLGAAPGASRGPARSARTSGTAVAAVVFSVLGFLCLPGIGSLAGVTLGIAARGEIERSEGRSAGRGLASAGIVLGVLGLLTSTLLFALLVVAVSRPSPTAATPRSWPSPVPTLVVPPAPYHHRPAPTPAPAATPRGAAASRDASVTVSHIGDITLVDVGDVTSLHDELGRQRAAAQRANERLVLWTVQADCKPCNGVAASLTAPSVQTALSKVRLVRVDYADYELELRKFSIPIKIPGFALFDGRDRPVDYVHGGEWDDDVPRNIAPVLGAFVRGTYTHRRDPWTGPRRRDEAPL